MKCEMRKTIATLFFIFSIVFVAVSQSSEKSPIVQFLLKRGYTFPDSIRQTQLPDSLRKWPDSVYYNTVYRAKLLGSPTIPISFSRIEYNNGKYEVSPTISIGYGYTWFWGDFILNENDKISVDPKFFFGLIADVAIQNDFNFKKPAGFFTGGFVGFGAFSLFFGYDLISISPAVGLGGRVDLYTIKQKALKPFGRVYPVRKHKRIAPRVENE